MKYLKGTPTIILDASKCTGCGRCMEVCPRQVFTMNEKKAAVSDRDSCIECGACAVNCEFGALSVAAGVGCAAAVIKGMRKGTAPACGCGSEDSGSACCG